MDRHHFNEREDKLRREERLAQEERERAEERSGCCSCSWRHELRLNVRSIMSQPTP